MSEGFYVENKVQKRVSQQFLETEKLRKRITEKSE